MKKLPLRRFCLAPNPSAPPRRREEDSAQFANTVEDLTKRNVEAISQLEKAVEESRTTADRAADAISRFCGSMIFVYAHIAWFGGWIAINLLLPKSSRFDPFPFNFLTLTVSLEAIFLSTFILISQNHESRVADRRNHLDLQVNLLAEQENTKMLQMLDAIAQKVGAEVGDPTLKLLEEVTQPRKARRAN